MVPRVDVRLNSDRICVAGIKPDAQGVLSVIVDLVQGTSGDDKNSLFICAYIRDGSDWQWGLKQLGPGDEIVIRLLPPGEFDNPRPLVLGSKVTEESLNRNEKITLLRDQVEQLRASKSRVCPKCNTSFKLAQSHGRCPVCGIVFLAGHPEGTRAW